MYSEMDFSAVEHPPVWRTNPRKQENEDRSNTPHQVHSFKKRVSFRPRPKIQIRARTCINLTDGAPLHKCIRVSVDTGPAQILPS